MIGSLSVLAGGALGTALIYFYTKENMWEGGKDNFLPLNADEKDWELVFKYFETNQNSITNEELKEIKDQQSLKNWCSKKYEETFSSLFQTTNWMQLSEMKQACLLPIREKLKNSSQTLITKKEVDIDKLKNHNDNDSTYKLTYRLRGIKNMSNLDEQFRWAKENILKLMPRNVRAWISRSKWQYI